MCDFPDVQIKAQEEIDRVIGKDQLPTLADRASLPYVGAVVKETLCWFTVTPMGLPHVNLENEVFEGYLIPKGSLVMANIW